ncbi:MAG: DNA repair photolyase, partial [Oligoflexia bacterium]|nr:DNA repair photolyase [Oligoflexia bacterium]
ADFKMWEDDSLISILKELKSQTILISKIQFLKLIHEKYHQSKERLKEYPPLAINLISNPAVNLRPILTDSGKKIAGMCPVASTKTLCCNLRTIDVVQNCAFGCSYCSIQTFYNKGQVMVENNLKDKLDTIEIDTIEISDKKRLYHFGVGQSSDSLLLGNYNSILDSLMNWATKYQENIILEFKTKSQNIDYFLEKKHKSEKKENFIPKNVFISWSLNTETIIKNEEHLTSSLSDRLQAARKILDQKLGIKVAFHFHPIVYYKNWQSEYHDVVKRLHDNFDPSEILFISLGTVTMIKPVIHEMRIRGAQGNLKSKILQMPMQKIFSRFSYPIEIKSELFTQVYSMFEKDWREDIFFYLCMEPKECWERISFTNFNFNSNSNSNEDFEQQLCLWVKRKQL